MQRVEQVEQVEVFHSFNESLLRLPEASVESKHAGASVKTRGETSGPPQLVCDCSVWTGSDS